MTDSSKSFLPKSTKNIIYTLHNQFLNKNVKSAAKWLLAEILSWSKPPYKVYSSQSRMELCMRRRVAAEP